MYLARMQERDCQPRALGNARSPAPLSAAHRSPGRWATLVSVLAMAVLAGCASTPRPQASGGGPFSSQRDGPAANPPANLDRVPDAEPRVESLRAGGPNKPYEINGKRYEPQPRDMPLKQRGLASWYGRKFHGRRTANGEVYDMYAMTAAHPTMPLPSYAQVRNPANGREIVVRINDRGPFHPGRIIDLSYTAALKLDLLRGVGMVEVERITHDAIRTGQWKLGRQDGAALARAGTSAPAPETAGSPTAATSPTLGGSPAPPGSPSAVAATTAVPVASSPGADAAPAAVLTTSGAAVTQATTSAARAMQGPVDEPRAARTEPAVPPDFRTAEASTTAGLRDAGPSTAPAASTDRTVASTPVDAQPSGFWVQLGVFRQSEGATSFSRQVARELDWVAPLLAVFRDSGLHRLQAGPFADRHEAQGAADRLRQALRLVPLIVEKR